MNRLELASRPDYSLTVRNREMGAQPMWGEKPKTLEEVRYIREVEKILSEKAKSLGITGFTLPINRVHFLEPDVYYDKDQGFKDSTAVCLHGSYSIVVCNDGNPGKILSRLIEEGTHLMTTHRHLHNILGKNYVAREVGYDYAVYGHQFFEGLTEGATAFLSSVGTSFQKLIKAFSLTQVEQEDLFPQAHILQRIIVDKVAQLIANSNGISKNEAHSRLKKGLKGSESHLWLKGSLGENDFEMLAYFGADNNPMNKVIWEYFLNNTCDRAAALKVCRETVSPSTGRTYQESYQIFLDHLKRDQIAADSQLIAA